MDEPLLLVTNDDGVNAPGIRALAAALRAVGEVRVVAPDREVSASSQALTISQPLRSEDVEPGVQSVDGTPADCVNLAIAKLLPRRPDLVVSGINRGANLGDDVFYSGTVGAAREAVFFGAPAIAVSLVTRETGADFSVAAEFVAGLARTVLAQGLPETTLLNVNVPEGRATRAVITVQGRRGHAGKIQEGVDPRRQPYFWIEHGGGDWAKDERSDYGAIRAGLISVTPLQTDTTHHAALASFAKWERDGLL